MSGLDWRKAQLSGKRTLSTRDETEYRDRDAAARWLSRNEKAKPKRRHSAPSTQGAATVSEATR